MMTEQLEKWGRTVAEFGGTAKQWLRYNAFLYRNTDFSGKSVVDIGGGVGRASYYAAAAGAKRVVCVEPEADGSNNTMHDSFKKLGEKLGFGVTVEFIDKPIQDVDFHEKFDVVLVHNSINHLDEEACSRLEHDEDARQKYQSFFKSLADLTETGGQLVITDCSNRNLFGKFGLRNPFAPTINWKIHQSPEVWAGLLGKHGFANPVIRWTADRRTGALGEMLMANRLVSYCLQSHFCLTLTKR